MRGDIKMHFTFKVVNAGLILNSNHLNFPINPDLRDLKIYSFSILGNNLNRFFNKRHVRASSVDVLNGCFFNARSRSLAQAWT
jgi:hypothetical protein